MQPVQGGLRADRDHEREEDETIHKIPSGRLARHLYDRHSNDVWAYLNLTMSTFTMYLLGRSVAYPSPLTWVIGWTASELGQVYIVLQCINLYRIFTYHKRVFQTFFGRLAMLVNMWALGSIAKSMFQHFGARAELVHALRAQKIQPRAGDSSKVWGPFLSLIPLFIVSRRGRTLRYRSNIPYANLEQVDPALLHIWKCTPLKLRNISPVLVRGRISKWLTLDVICQDGLKNAPVLMYVHGGGWMLGDKFIGPRAVTERVASRGIVVVRVNYRMSPEVAWPSHILDVKRALIFVKENCAQWGGDPAKVFVGGESAGGHLSGLVGVTPNLLLYQPPESKDKDTSIAGCIPICGVFDFTDEYGYHKAQTAKLFEIPVGIRSMTSRLILQTRFNPETKREFNLASPTFHIRELINAETKPNIPPFFIPHGDRDFLAAYEDSKVFYDELQRLRQKWGTWAEGESDVHATVKGALHAAGLYFPSHRAHALGDAITDFIFHHSRPIDARKSHQQ